jgi:hypothetical protein
MIVRFGVEKLSLRKADEKKRDHLTHIFLCNVVGVSWQWVWRFLAMGVAFPGNGEVS